MALGGIVCPLHSFPLESVGAVGTQIAETAPDHGDPVHRAHQRQGGGAEQQGGGQLRRLLLHAGQFGHYHSAQLGV